MVSDMQRILAWRKMEWPGVSLQDNDGILDEGFVKESKVGCIPGLVVV